MGCPWPHRSRIGRSCRRRTRHLLFARYATARRWVGRARIHRHGLPTRFLSAVSLLSDLFSTARARALQFKVQGSKFKVSERNLELGTLNIELMPPISQAYSVASYV